MELVVHSFRVVALHQLGLLDDQNFIYFVHEYLVFQGYQVFDVLVGDQSLGLGGPHVVFEAVLFLLFLLQDPDFVLDLLELDLQLVLLLQDLLLLLLPLCLVEVLLELTGLVSLACKNENVLFGNLVLAFAFLH